jgi:hypothetical protein
MNECVGDGDKRGRGCVVCILILPNHHGALSVRFILRLGPGTNVFSKASTWHSLCTEVGSDGRCLGGIGVGALAQPVIDQCGSRLEEKRVTRLQESTHDTFQWSPTSKEMIWSEGTMKSQKNGPISFRRPGAAIGVSTWFMMKDGPLIGGGVADQDVRR